ncbi:MAG: UDP-N-acetylglucosamine 2-epimerase (non-hydrolyzing), partial [Gammaproteobacteria bacterium]|nr:UDP-N-acetylglucosamine 2-epimerase (non-hydrolyzing) [Gammaproteobacteria bacterium]
MSDKNKIVVDLIAAARPNFMKVAPLYHALKDEDWCQLRLVHTGQHYDPNMSQAFFDDLGLPKPDRHLGVGSGSHAEQTAGVMVAYEQACIEARPDWVVVVGDVNSTIACALVAKKLHIKVAHLEAGLRSRDRAMPEEINRILTDSIADLLWTPSSDGDDNLQAEGVAAERIELIGNIMIDSFEMRRAEIEAAGLRSDLGFDGKEYGVVTLHRPSNVDDRDNLETIVEQLAQVAAGTELIFPVHPRTLKQLGEFGLEQRLRNADGITLIEPVGYVDFMNLVTGAAVVITDSGGIQEETSYLGIRCLT